MSNRRVLIKKAETLAPLSYYGFPRISHRAWGNYGVPASLIPIRQTCSVYVKEFSKK